MTVKELKEQLKGYPDGMELVVQSDPEGNAYLPMQGIDTSIDVDGDYYDTNWSAEDAGMEEWEWEETKASRPKVLIAYP